MFREMPTVQSQVRGFLPLSRAGGSLLDRATSSIVKRVTGCSFISERILSATKAKTQIRTVPRGSIGLTILRSLARVYSLILEDRVATVAQPG